PFRRDSCVGEEGVEFGQGGLPVVDVEVRVVAALHGGAQADVPSELDLVRFEGNLPVRVVEDQTHLARVGGVLVLSAIPDEVRQLARAEGKRKETEENLDRIRIILDEIDKQIKQLESDRDGALKYRDLNERLTTAKAQLAYKNRELIERQIVGTREQIAKHEGDKAKLAAQKEELRGRLDAAVARLSELEQEMADRGGEEAKQLKDKLA